MSYNTKGKPPKYQEGLNQCSESNMEISMTVHFLYPNKTWTVKKNLKYGESKMLKMINEIREFSVKFYSHLGSSAWKNMTAISKPKYTWTKLSNTK